jgi:hypothetical protein
VGSKYEHIGENSLQHITYISLQNTCCDEHIQMQSHIYIHLYIILGNITFPHHSTTMTDRLIRNDISKTQLLECRFSTTLSTRPNQACSQGLQARGTTTPGIGSWGSDNQSLWIAIFGANSKTLRPHGPSILMMLNW